ncbi:hypothetical protein F4225_11400, partial [Candidatus Poribacteria bacterium]|nr:hypothetical protein [Candidatus Poribacteria bacterium]
MGKIVRGKTICDNFEHEFKINKYENMFSDRDILYPKRARLLLSILIDRAKKGLPPIGTAEVAKELEIPGHS